MKKIIICWVLILAGLTLPAQEKGISSGPSRSASPSSASSANTGSNSSSYISSAVRWKPIQATTQATTMV